MDRYLEVGRGGDVKFLVVSSDVIYPAGAMTEYERNFYLPFKGSEPRSSRSRRSISHSSRSTPASPEA